MSNPWHWLWEDGGYMLLEDDPTAHWILEESPTGSHSPAPTTLWTPVDDSELDDWVEIPDPSSTVIIRR